MSPRDDDLARALVGLRTAANPGAGAQQRVRAALRSRGSGSPPPLLDARTLAAGTRPAAGWHLSRRPLAWSLALGLALFGAGFGLGRSTQQPPAPPAPPRPLELIESSALAAGALETDALETDVEVASAVAEARSASEAHPAWPDPTAASAARATSSERPAPPPRRARPSRGASASNTTKSELSLAEALALLHRADRAIYSGQAPWALSLLDELDARAPQKLLREERLATRVLALCRDGQAQQARALADATRREAPASIYGALLERGCGEAAASE